MNTTQTHTPPAAPLAGHTPGHSEVHDLASGTVQFFSTGPEDALISAAIMADRRTGSLTDTKTRDAYRARIISGKRSISIGDLCALTGRESC